MMILHTPIKARGTQLKGYWESDLQALPVPTVAVKATCSYLAPWPELVFNHILFGVIFTNDGVTEVRRDWTTSRGGQAYRDDTVATRQPVDYIAILPFLKPEHVTSHVKVFLELLDRPLPLAIDLYCYDDLEEAVL